MPRCYYEDARWPWRPDAFLRRFLKKHRKQRRQRKKPRALDLGMGYGRNALWLAQQGFLVEGWEADRRYAAEAEREARRRGVPLRVCRGDFCRARFRGPYEIIVISHSLHQLKRSQALQTLRRAQDVLAPGGWLFLLAKLTPDRYFQPARQDPGWRPVPGERNTFRHRRHGWVLSALEPGEIKTALRTLRLRHYRQTVLRSAWEPRGVTHHGAECVAQKPKRGRLP